MNKEFLLGLILVFQSLQLFGQGPEPASLQALARYNNGKVELRWAPVDYSAWQRGNKNGYLVERYDESGIQRLTQAPIMPFSLVEWASNTDTSSIWNKAAAQLLHGKMKGMPENPSLAQVKEVSQLQAYQLANALIAADMSAEAARGMALAFTDPTAQPGKTYGYRIIIANALPGKPDTTRVFVETSSAWQAPRVKGLTAENAEHSVVLKWSKLLNSGHFTAFWVEKSTNGGKTFQRINREPLFVSGFAEEGAENFYIDSLQRNYQPSQYRVLGITPWGDTGLASETVTGMGRDLTPPGAAQKVKAESLAPNRISITWEAAVNPADLAGWYVRRSNDAAGVFTNINSKPLPASARQFSDVEPYVFQHNYYKVVAVDTAGNEGVSFHAYCYIVDSIPPAQPLGLTGVIDSTGFVALAWDMGQEQDLRGYRVYVSHGPDREFKQLTSEPVFQNYFSDTIPLKTLTEKIYYRVAAVDYRWNHSVYSGLLELEKPDIVPPVAPVMKKYKVNADSVQLEWANSTSADVVGLVLWKQETGGDWQILQTFKKPFPNRYTDQDLSPDLRISYALEAIDDDNLRSGKSKSISIQTQAQRPPVQELTAQLDQQKATATLRWNYEIVNGRFVVMRAKAGEPYTAVQSLSDKETTFTDFLPASGNYQYQIRALFPDGTESDPGKVVSVSFQ
jgi:hypothetical protein